MIAGFIGLGLIGGSMAMALAGFEDAQVFCVDKDAQTRKQALERGVVYAAFEDAKDAPLEQADVIVLCLHPEASVAFVRDNGARMKQGSVLTDVCGIKGELCRAVDAHLACGAAFIGGHPMAGKERGGFINASASIFIGAHYILVPTSRTTPQAKSLLERIVSYMGCRDVILADPETHDKRIAYTSQMMHVLALAICDQTQLMDSKGFEGGSFRAATRVAALDADLWTQLFWNNREALAEQTEELIDKLKEYAALLQGDDRQALHTRIKQSADRKVEFNHA